MSERMMTQQQYHDEDDRLALADHLESLAVDIAGASMAFTLGWSRAEVTEQLAAAITRCMLLRKGLLTGTPASRTLA